MPGASSASVCIDADVARHLLQVEKRFPAFGRHRAWRARHCADGEVIMLWTIFVVLLLLWFLGVVSSYTLGGFIHILLVLAVIAVLVQLISGRRTTI
jgi:uncharacterized protein DUF5670